MSNPHRSIAQRLLPLLKWRFCQSMQKSSEKQKFNFCRSSPFHIKTRVALKYFANDCGRSHIDMDGFIGTLWPIADGFEQWWLLYGDCRCLWGDGFGWLWMVLGGFTWLSEICSFSSYGEIHCFKFKKSRQLWELFVLSSNNDAKVLFKWSIFGVIQNIKFHSKRPWLGERSFFLWKLTYIALRKFSWYWLRFSKFQVFQGSPHLAQYWLAGLYSSLIIWQIFLFIETLL